MENSKKVLIFGILGQDGSNMAEYLLANTNHLIYGVSRRWSRDDSNIKSFIDNPRFKILFGDLSDENHINSLVKEIQPDYLINFAASSFIGSFCDAPLQVFNVNTFGVLRCLEAIRKFQPNCRFFSSGSSQELEIAQKEYDKFPFKAKSPYATSKAASRAIVRTYREFYGLYAIHGILANHEGTKRSEEFVTRKITKGIARIVKAIEKGESFEPIKLGNLEVKKDWSDSEDFCDGIWRMLNQDVYNGFLGGEIVGLTQGNMAMSYGKEFLIKNIKEYILSSNETHSIREFCEKALKLANIEGYWQGKGIHEKFYIADYILESINCKSSVIVELDQNLFRPDESYFQFEVNSNLIRKELGWNPKISFDKLVEKMLYFDLNGQKEIPNAQPRDNQ